MESLLLAVDVGKPSMNDLNAIFRSAHSIKGGAGTFGFTDMIVVIRAMVFLLNSRPFKQWQPRPRSSRQRKPLHTAILSL